MKPSILAGAAPISFLDYLDSLSPTHWWYLDDSGEPMADYGAQNSPRGTGAGTPGFQTTIGSYTGVDLDGSTEYLDNFSTGATLTDNGNFSMFGIIQPDTFPSSGVEVVLSTCEPGQSPFARGVLFGVINGGGLYCNIANNVGTSNAATSSGGVVSTSVHTVGLTYDGSEVRVFADGSEVASVAHNAGVDHNTQLTLGYHIGNTSGSASYYDGTLAHVAWFNNTTISDAEHAELHTKSGV